MADQLTKESGTCYRRLSTKKGDADRSASLSFLTAASMTAVEFARLRASVTRMPVSAARWSAVASARVKMTFT